MLQQDHNSFPHKLATSCSEQTTPYICELNFLLLLLAKGPYLQHSHLIYCKNQLRFLRKVRGWQVKLHSAIVGRVEKVKFSGARNRRDAMFIVTSQRSGVRARETESNGAAFNPLSLLWCAGAQLPHHRHARHHALAPSAVPGT